MRDVFQRCANFTLSMGQLEGKDLLVLRQYIVSRPNIEFI